MNLTDLRNDLLNKQAELQKRIDAIGNDFKKGRSADFADQATERENDEVLSDIRVEAKNELQQINDALSRIGDDQYGKCSACAEDIAPERLQALPYVTTCISCAQ